jgi:hypothetical protein
MVGAQCLDALVMQAERLEGVRKADVRGGDWVLVHTLNSLYSIYVLGDGTYRVSGGWFDREGKAPATIAINGCTWGGRAIKSDMVAARGLCLEFGNWVITTRIQKIRVIRSSEQEVRVQ